jgi:PEP-CTERM motif
MSTTAKHSIFAATIAILTASAMPVSAATVISSSTLTSLILPTSCSGSGFGGACGASTNPTFFGAVGPSISGGASAGWTGTWSASGPASAGGPVAAAWVGTITSSGGAYPSSPVAASTTTWNFSSLSGGSLPVGTFVGFGDLDDGSGQTEEYELMAFNSARQLITTAWLSGVGTNGVTYDSSAVNCTPGCNQAAMPEYVWGGTTGETGVGGSPVAAGVYEFDGLNVTLGNPTETVWLTTNTAITSLSVEKFTNNNSFQLAAPTAVPEPSTWAMLLLGFAGLGFAGYRGARAGHATQRSPPSPPAAATRVAADP